MRIKNKIIFFSNSSWNLFKFRLPLINSLKKKNFDVITVSPEDQYIDLIKNKVNKHITLNLSKKNSTFLLFIRDILFFYKIIKIEKPNIVLSYTIKCNIINILISKICGVKAFTNITGLGSVFLKKNFIYIFISKIIIFFYKSHNQNIFQNLNDAKVIYGKDYKTSKFFYLPGLGVNTKFYKPKLKKNKKIINFFMISRIIKDKGVLEYLKAAEIISNRYSNIKFNYVGDFDVENPSSIDSTFFYDNLKKSCINYYKPKKNIKYFLNKADCIVHPSYREGVSNVLLEAASMEIPIIASNVPGCNDIVKDNFNGILCKPKNINNLANCILKFISLTKNKKKKMGKLSRIFVIKNFEQKNIVKKYIKLINE